MEAVYVPKERNRIAGNDLREVAARYITNGRYNPMRSAVIAEEYKQGMERKQKRRVQSSKEQSMIFNNFDDLIENKIKF